MEHEEFTKALLIAFNDDAIKRSLVEIVAQAVSGPVAQRVTESLKNEIVLLRKDLRARDQTIAKMQETIGNLSAETDRLEQYTRRNSVRVAGIPEEIGEDATAKVLHLVNQDMNLDPPLVLSEIDRIHRVGKPKSGPGARPRSILVKLATYRSRKRIMDKRASLKQTHLSHVFINEDLTSKRATLLYKARRLKHSRVIKDAWTGDGTILIKDNQNKIVTISNESELRALECENQSSPS